VLRSLAASDLPSLEAILRANRPLFSERECAVAIDMARASLAAVAEDDPYHFVVAEHRGGVVGYACFGTVPLTQGTYDLYWIVVHPDAQRGGIGKTLMMHCEAEIAHQGGRLVVAETSSRAAYAGTRRFYEEAMGYEPAARIADFYTLGDDKIVYVKYLDAGKGGSHDRGR
jgi:ribosomal protein S18 acetylase RimI-like enzyme